MNRLEQKLKDALWEKYSERISNNLFLIYDKEFDIIGKYLKFRPTWLRLIGMNGDKGYDGIISLIHDVCIKQELDELINE